MKQELEARFIRICEVLQRSTKQARLLEVRAAVSDPTLWDDQERAVGLQTELSELESLITRLDDTEALLELSEQEQELSDVAIEIANLERLAILSGEHDNATAILTIHAGTGGTDAQDWAQMLERMFLRYVESGTTELPEDRTLSVLRSNWKAELLDENRGEEAGIKKATIRVTGSYAFGLLKAEAGVHRLVRQSPFNAKGLRQTSFALVEVIPEVDQSKAPQIAESELKIDVFRSGGAGGQHVNTTDSAVRITHIPSGIVVTVQNERSQQQNKATALKILQSRLSLLQALKNAEELAILKGEVKEGSWGNQIRSYVLHPYQLVKDHRTEYETSQTTAVLDGDLQGFIEAYLTKTTV